MTGKIQTGHAIRGESLMNTKKKSIVLKLINIQGDLPSMLISIVSLNNEFIQILIFGIFKFTQKLPYFQIPEIFFTTY